MATRPTLMPSLMAAITEAVPSRLVRKLDKNPTLAEAWSWSESGTEIVTDRGERVALEAVDGILSALEQLSCTCLLAPRCLHLFAVARALDLVEVSEAKPAERAREDGAADPPMELTDDLRAIARDTFDVAAQVLAVGLTGMGALLQAELLRAAHTCRAVGLYRLGAGALAVVRSARALQDRDADGSLDQAKRALDELLHTSHRLAVCVAGDEAERVSWVGVARRRYRPLGNLRLRGLFCEPVVTRTGYAGVVTTLADDAGTMWTLSDVLPGEPSRVAAAYASDAVLGDLAVAHRALCRSGVFVQGATGSPDGRLGAGSAVRAVRDTAASDANSDAAGFSDSLDTQLARVFGAIGRPALLRPAGSHLLFLEVEVLGACEDALVVALADGGRLALTIPVAAPGLPGWENLGLLARAPGLTLRIVARADPLRPRRAVLLAVVGGGLVLPEVWRGQVNIGLDPLRRSYLPEAGGDVASSSLPAAATAVDPLAGFARRLDRVARGGWRTLPPEVGREIAADCRGLDQCMLPTGAVILRWLHRIANDRPRDFSGRLRPVDAGAAAEVWIAASRYREGVQRSVLRGLWS